MKNEEAIVTFLALASEIEEDIAKTTVVAEAAVRAATVAYNNANEVCQVQEYTLPDRRKGSNHDPAKPVPVDAQVEARRFVSEKREALQASKDALGKIKADLSLKETRAATFREAAKILSQ